MIMTGLYNTKEVPFRHVYLHGLIRDAKGRKMTKSLGNVVDPIKVIDRYGCDALRFVLATGGAPGNDFRLTDERLEGGRNFANKIWNASRFVIQSIGDERVDAPDPKRRADMPIEDRWILSRLQRVVTAVDGHLNRFQIGEAGHRLHEFFWSEFCDWYVEMAKVRLKAGDESPLPVLAAVLQASLRMLHPIMPFITEAVWQHLRERIRDPEAESIMECSFPQGVSELDPEAEQRMAVVMEVVRAIRNIRADRHVEPSRYVEAYVAADGARPVLEAARPILESLARVRPLHLVRDAAEAPKSGVASAVLAQAQVILPLAGLIDMEGERARLSKQMAEAEGEVKRLESKLANKQFREKAPAAVVAKEEDKLAAARARLEGLRQRLAELG
jgi:valyl-tRNA synthetase